MKRQRQNAILELVEREPIGSQAAIAGGLRKLGFEVTQSTVSRDLEELGLARVRDERGRLRYAPPAAAVPAGRLEQLRRLVEEFVLGMTPSGNLLVVRTPPGTANAVAQAIDAAGLDDVIGTVAGDDTILVVAREGVKAATVERRLRMVASLEETK